MSILLTEEQRQVIEIHSESPPRLIDPKTNEAYVLLRADVYERAKALFEEDENQLVRDMYPHMWEVFGKDGWDDPPMDVYNNFDTTSKS